MTTNEFNTITREGIKSVIKQAWEQLNNDTITEDTYTSVIDTLCITHGSEYIAECFVEMTKAGELA